MDVEIWREGKHRLRMNMGNQGPYWTSSGLASLLIASLMIQKVISDLLRLMEVSARATLSGKKGKYFWEAGQDWWRACCAPEIFRDIWLIKSHYWDKSTHCIIIFSNNTFSHAAFFYSSCYSARYLVLWNTAGEENSSGDRKEAVGSTGAQPHSSTFWLEVPGLAYGAGGGGWGFVPFGSFPLFACWCSLGRM